MNGRENCAVSKNRKVWKASEKLGSNIHFSYGHDMRDKFQSVFNAGTAATSAAPGTCS